MNAVAQVCAALSAVVFIAVFPLEAFFIDRPWAQRFLNVEPLTATTSPAVHLWSFNVGARNLLSGIGVLVGLGIATWGSAGTGTTVVAACCAYQVLCSLAMGLCDLLGYWRPRGGSVGGTIGAAILPAVALVALAL